jgi:8-oxo-dGTP diphosphatase
MDTARETPETVRLTADVIVFARNTFGQRHVLMIQRKYDPHQGQWALPGGHVDNGEDPKHAAHRELTEETGLTVATLLPVGVYAAPGRDPRGRYVTFAYATMLNVDELPTPTAQDDAAAARWVPLRTVRNSELAFDHGQILDDALDAIGN